MAVVVESNSVWPNSTNTSVTSITIDLPAGTQEGDLLVVFLGLGSAATVTYPSGWVESFSLLLTSRSQTIAYKVAGGSEPSSYTFDFSSSQRHSGAILRLSGADTVSPVRAAAGNDVLDATGFFNSTSPFAPSISAEAGDLLLSFDRNAGSCTITANPSGMATEVNWLARGFDEQGVASEVLVSSGATGTRTWTISDSRGWTCSNIAIAPAAGGGDPGPSGTSLNYWSGSAWVPAPLMRWDGTAWVAAEVQRWNGTAWEAVT